MKKLKRHQWETLQIQYARTPDCSESFGSGEHMMLIAVLNKLGHYPRSRQSAMSLAAKLLCKGYDDDFA